MLSNKETYSLCYKSIINISGIWVLLRILYKIVCCIIWSAFGVHLDCIRIAFGVRLECIVFEFLRVVYNFLQFGWSLLICKKD
jgi:hypothetical protein